MTTHALDTLRHPLTEVREGLQSARHALAALESTAGDAFHDTVSAIDRSMYGVYTRLESCRKYLSLRRKSVHRTYDPVRLIKTQSAFMPMPVTHTPPKPVAPLEGDTQQILDVLRIIWANAVVAPGGQLTTALYTEGEGPRFAIGIAGEGHFPDRYAIGNGLTLSLDELDERWHDATKGGYINAGDQLLTLLLVGEDYAPAAAPDLKHQSDLLDRGTRKLMPWRAASGSYEDGLVHPDDTRSLYLQAFDQVSAAIEEILGTPPETEAA